MNISTKDSLILNIHLGKQDEKRLEDEAGCKSHRGISGHKSDIWDFQREWCHDFTVHDNDDNNETWFIKKL